MGKIRKINKISAKLLRKHSKYQRFSRIIPSLLIRSLTSESATGKFYPAMARKVPCPLYCITLIATYCNKSSMLKSVDSFFRVGVRLATVCVWLPQTLEESTFSNCDPSPWIIIIQAADKPVCPMAVPEI